MGAPTMSLIQALTKALRETRNTRTDNVAAGIRIAVGLLFLMTGVMKIAVPALGAAFAGQLAAANVPFQELSRWAVPFFEMGVGVALLVGLYSRVATLLVFNIMIVATYTHFVANDPALFPLQPEEPIIPLAVMALAVYLIVKGGGSMSLDLKATGAAGHGL